jgi:hypothetical protein
MKPNWMAALQLTGAICILFFRVDFVFPWQTSAQKCTGIRFSPTRLPAHADTFRSIVHSCLRYTPPPLMLSSSPTPPHLGGAPCFTHLASQCALACLSAALKAIWVGRRTRSQRSHTLRRTRGREESVLTLLLLCTRFCLLSQNKTLLNTA